MTEPRRARVQAFAKVNLALRVLHRRPDQYHELRTIFQTVSLADTIEISFTPAASSRIEISGADIPGNLMVKAAELVLDAARRAGDVRFHLRKRIPWGAGLGGGSSDAAAVLLALPVLAGAPLCLSELLSIAAQLGSDVPFFLLGGRAVALGRGTELYPLPDIPARPGLLIAPDLHSSTAEAYRALGARLTTESEETKMCSFQQQAWDDGGREPGAGGLPAAVNDFEPVVFEKFPALAAYKQRLLERGAGPALMSGSGSAVFGFFRTRERAREALAGFAEERVFPIMQVSRARYRRAWWRALGSHIEQNLWPPPSRYVR